MPPPFYNITMNIELIYSFVIIICSLMIYFGTKELYELSSYKGLKYFRLSFLFFAIVYLFRFLIRLSLLTYNAPRMLDMTPRILGHSAQFIFMYFSSMAVFYLIYSIIWKKFKENSKTIYLFHGLALLLSSITLFFRGPGIILITNVFLLLFVVIIFLLSYKKSKIKKRGLNLYFAYILLFIFWILNIIDLLVPNFLELIQLFIYLASLSIFLLILYKVLKKTG